MADDDLRAMTELINSATQGGSGARPVVNPPGTGAEEVKGMPKRPRQTQVSGSGIFAPIAALIASGIDDNTQQYEEEMDQYRRETAMYDALMQTALVKGVPELADIAARGLARRGGDQKVLKKQINSARIMKAKMLAEAEAERRRNLQESEEAWENIRNLGLEDRTTTRIDPTSGKYTFTVEPDKPLTEQEQIGQYLETLQKVDPEEYVRYMNIKTLYSDAKEDVFINEATGIRTVEMRQPDGTVLWTKSDKVQPSILERITILEQEEIAKRLAGEAAAQKIAAGYTPGKEGEEPKRESGLEARLNKAEQAKLDTIMSMSPGPLRRDSLEKFWTSIINKPEIGTEATRGIGLMRNYNKTIDGLERTLGYRSIVDKPLSELTNADIDLIDAQMDLPSSKLDPIVKFADEMNVPWLYEEGRTQRIDIRAETASLIGLLYAMHGKQLSDRELERALEYFPVMATGDKDYLVKLRNFKQRLDSILEENVRAYGEAGYDISRFERDYQSEEDYASLRARTKAIFKKYGIDPNEVIPAASGAVGRTIEELNAEAERFMEGGNE